MTINLTIIGGDKLRDSILPIISSRSGFTIKGEPIDCTEFDQIQVVILVVKDVEDAFKRIHFLRIDRKYHGLILILSFFTKSWAIKQEWGEALNTLGCYYLQLPFLLSNFIDLISISIQLSDNDLQIIKSKLGARTIIQRIGLVKHEYDNNFGLILLTMREIEKLSYSKKLNDIHLQKLAKAFKLLKNQLTPTLLQKFKLDIETLSNEIYKWEEGRNLVMVSRVFDEWFEFCKRVEVNLIDEEKLGDKIHEIKNELFIQNRYIFSSIKEIFDLMAKVRKEAQKVLVYDK